MNKYKFIADASTHLRNYNPQSQKLVYMSPTKFLSLVGFLPYKSQINLSDESLSNIRKAIISEKPIEIPFIDIDIETKQVTNHEGRHRMIVCNELGITRVPVILYFKSGGYFVDIRGKNVPDISEIRSQW